MSSALAARDMTSNNAVGNRLFTSYGMLLFDYCLLLIQDVSRATTAVHDSILVATSNQERLGHVEDDQTWLYAIARNECARGQLPPEPGRVAPEPVSPLGEKADEVSAAVWHAVGRLDQPSRELILLNSRHRLSYPHIATMLGVSPRRVRWRANQAHRRLELAVGAAPAVGDLARHGVSLRHRVEVVLASGQLCEAPEGLKDFVRGSCGVPARVLHYGVRAGQFQSNGFPKPWDRHQSRHVSSRSVAAGCVLLLPLLAAADGVAGTGALSVSATSQPGGRHAEAAGPPGAG
ncbi:MAG: sigma-70 family RNA polymerase sigma factor, partial [Actinocatenispora sp.]